MSLGWISHERRRGAVVSPEADTSPPDESVAVTLCPSELYTVMPCDVVACPVVTDVEPDAEPGGAKEGPQALDCMFQR